MVPFTGYHLRWGVTRTATGCFQSLSHFVSVTESEIHNLDVVVIVEKQIFRLKIPVTNLVLMEVLYSRKDLLEKATGILVLEPFPFDYVVEKFASVGIFHD